MNEEMLGVIDATVAYHELNQLILDRLPSALQFAGRYRLIDFALSNLKNSAIRNVAIFPNGNYRSLTDHVSSGKVWDLDRKIDGLFVLPPKKIFDQSDDLISFNRMKEHLAFFIRSKQKYVVLTSGVIVWNINFQKPLESHIESMADITEVIHKNQKLNTYILEKDYLIQLILQHEYLGYKNLNEAIKFGQNIKVNYYYHNGYTKMIKNIHDFYHTNLDILNFDIGRTIFTTNFPILSQVRDYPPTYYGEHANVSNSIIAHGATIDGTVENCVISRDVSIKEGAHIKDSIVMQETKIESDAILEFCIIDKRCVIGDHVVLKGTKENPIIVSKEEKLISKAKMSVFHVASECAPFVKTGGLADVVSALPKKERDLGIETAVCLPYYRQIANHYEDQLTIIHTATCVVNKVEYKIHVYSMKRDAVDYYFIEMDHFFDRDQLYGYPDDFLRFYAFNCAVLVFLDSFELIPNILHIHDYHPSLIPLMLKNDFSGHTKFNQLKTVLTIHNLQYQGQFITTMDLPYSNNGTVNFLKQGIRYSDLITTVSETYSQEIQYDYFSEGLKDEIIKRKSALIGILNGLDEDVFNPETDVFISENYTIQTFEKKKINKRTLQYASNLTIDESIPVIGMVTRLVEQKGLDLILSVFDELMTTFNVQFVLLGTGDSYYQDQFKLYEKKYPNKVKINLGYDSFNPNQIYAGCDVFLMPSRFEPCGLSQMIALKYGTIPIVRETGGLKDTISPYNEFTKSGNGFSFTNYNAHDMLHTIKRAINFFYEKDHWNRLMISAMQCDFSYDQTAKHYYKVYEELLK